MIRLDDFCPEYVGRTVARGSSRRAVGVSPTNLLDWRRLGRRAAQLDAAATAAHSAFWAEMERLAPAASRRRGAWFSQPDDMLIKFTGESYTTEVASSALDRLTRGIEDDDFFLVPMEVGGHLMRMRDRANKLRGYHLTYQQAFRRAVEDRLRLMFQAESSASWFPPRTLLLHDGSNVHPILLDARRQITWLPNRLEDVS